ncbi:hypothetical protein [Argonema antarcticum]|uniref:hypothetical protein n=1 Tax=Argonema antarcticum TaxID=2942763 RepID=UPI0020125356|nr:hypothetical protein [Argonema antarcticum]MCL1469766.1 hypothetical protein [Argonema antarcticum A004/B2]
MSEEIAELEEIADNDRLYRRLSINSHINPKTGKVSSAAFKRNKKPENSISVDLARLTTPQETLDRVGDRKNHFVLGVLVAGDARSIGFSVRHDPILPENPAHSLIEGQNDGEKCSRLAEATTILSPPA